MKKTVKIERTYPAPVADVWELWTTKDGIEEWWGPDGFAVTVDSLDLRVGGELQYTMTAMLPDMIDFMKKNGMPTSTKSRLTFTEIVANRRLVYQQLTDFIPGVAPYEVTHRIELEETPAGTKLTVEFDAMHDDVWTQRAKTGMESQLGRLEKVLA